MHVKHEIRNYSLQNHVKHEIRNYSSQNHAEHEIRQNRTEHEIINYSSQNRAELKSGFQFNHAINNKSGFKPDQNSDA